MATSVDLRSVLDRAYEDKTLQDSQRSAVGARGSHGTPQPGAFRGLRHPDRGPNWGATSTSLWPESSSRSPGSFSP
jgi:hypothetical protein